MAAGNGKLCAQNLGELDGCLACLACLVSVQGTWGCGCTDTASTNAVFTEMGSRRTDHLYF